MPLKKQTKLIPVLLLNTCSWDASLSQKERPTRGDLFNRREALSVPAAASKITSYSKHKGAK